jgi:hypothetical protein
VDDAGVPATTRVRASIGVPWGLVLLYALALIVSGVVGLAMAYSLF